MGNLPSSWNIVPFPDGDDVDPSHGRRHVSSIHGHEG
jgi:hypothetical protein